jgi:hypothetical protein
MKNIGETIASHKKWVQPLTQKYPGRIRIVSPAVTNGQRDAQGNVMGLGYLAEFLRGCDGCQIDYVAVHWYVISILSLCSSSGLHIHRYDSAKNVEYFKRHIRDAHHIARKPVWITEFGPQGTETEQIRFLLEVLPWLDSQDYVYRYAMQWAGKGSLVNSAGTGLSRVGHVYNTL